jgi:hypothetical protein
MKLERRLSTFAVIIAALSFRGLPPRRAQEAGDLQDVALAGRGIFLADVYERTMKPISPFPAF